MAAKKGKGKIIVGILVLVFAILVTALSIFAVNYSKNLRAEGDGDLYEVQGLSVPSVSAVLGNPKKTKQVTKSDNKTDSQRVYLYDSSVLSAEEVQKYLQYLVETEGYFIVNNQSSGAQIILEKEYGDRVMIVSPAQNEVGDMGIIVQVKEKAADSSGGEESPAA